MKSGGWNVGVELRGVMRRERLVCGLEGLVCGLSASHPKRIETFAVAQDQRWVA